MSAKTPSLFGGAMIIAGTVIGAGMLANPTATSGVWFAGSLIVLLYTWFSMLSSGLMILEVNTHYPHGASFDTMVKDLLGPIWNAINGVAVAFVLYLLTYAYIFVGGDLTAKGLGGALGIKIPLTVGQLSFFLIFATCVWASARLVDRFTSILIGGMVLTFIWATGGLIAEAKRRFAIADAVCVHRYGRLEVGEMAVWVGVAAGHRDAGFAACRFIIDTVKAQVPIWKEEFYSGKSESAWLANPESHGAP